MRPGPGGPGQTTTKGACYAPNQPHDLVEDAAGVEKEEQEACGMSRETYDFTVDVTAATDKAIRINDGAEEQWLPKSQVECLTKPLDHIEEGDQVHIMIQEWLAKKKGLI